MRKVVIQMAGIKMRKAERVLFENPDIAKLAVDFDMTEEAMHHRLFLLRARAAAQAARKEVKTN